MSKLFSVREYEPGDEQGIVDLLELVFNGWPHFDLQCTPIEHWKWKYLDYPSNIKILTLATDSDKIIGNNPSNTRNAYLAAKLIFCSQGHDLAVHPDYRRYGVYTKIREQKTQLWHQLGINMSWGVSGNPIVFDANLEWGRRVTPHKVSTLLRIKDINLHFKMRGMEDEALKKIGVKLYKGISVLGSKLSSLKKEKVKDYEISDVKEFDEFYEAFWEKARGAYDFILDRSSEFMKWRYLDKRAGDFKVVAAKNGLEWLGYIIYRINKRNPDYPETRIADLLTLPGRSDVVMSLLEEVNNRMDDLEINALYSWAIESSDYYSHLEDLGFIDSRNVPYVTFQRINLGLEWEKFDKISANKMLLHFGDTDWV